MTRESGKWSRLPAWSKWACVSRISGADSGVMPSAAQIADGWVSMVRLRRSPPVVENPVSTRIVRAALRITQTK